MNKILELVDVSYRYNHETVLEEVNLPVYEKDFIGVIGPNGGGKTTLIKLILGLIKPVQGKIHYYKEGTNAAHIGYLPQNNYIDRKFPISVEDVVLSGLMSDKKSMLFYSGKYQKRVDEVLKQVHMEGIKYRPIGELSGGQMQKVLLARAIISSPALLILDEPDTFVDSQFEGELYELLKFLNEKMAIIIVSHDIGTISYYVKTIACVNKTFNYHKSNVITEKQLSAYNCPIQLITHGNVPHQVLKQH